jgi:class 3 adenylate cyclase
MMEHATFWDGLAARTKPSGAFVSIENPRTIVWMALSWTLGSALNSVVLAALFFWFDEPVTGWILVAFAFLFLFGWFLFVGTGRVRGTFALINVATVIGIAAVQVTMGGYANSGAILMWGIAITTVSALLFHRREAVAVGAIIAVVAVFFGFLEQTLQASRPAPDPTLPAVLFPYTLIALMVLVVPVMGLLVGRLSFERERAEGLLLNVLPAAVAVELKETGHTTARRYESVSVLFADIVGFTPLSAEMDPEAMVDQLNTVFTHFDQLADRYRCEKIRTIGDNYMVAAGVPTPTDDHAHALASMALEMLQYAKTGPLSFRLGINSGPVVAGVVGISKFQYDLWGDTVNIASRMESQGEPDRIQISEATYQLIKDDFDTTLRGPIEVKGKGTLTTWYLEHTRQPTTAATL